jgi:eukaryotic-like serine/threonine-protein kinase
METPLLARGQNPASLKVGMKIGPWRVVAWRGQGTYGVVYLVVRDGDEQSGTFALKMALRPMDMRFEREAELLARIHHRNVPRFYGAGLWECELGVFPYVVMEWVEGVGLYDWSSQHNPTSRQVLELLAQVARALEATQAVGGVHRDVKGANVLVRLADGRPYLTDFGSGAFEGAQQLTWDILAPGTEAYRSPEAWAYQRFYSLHPDARYEGFAKDDLFALGVMAYRLVTDEYPPPTHPAEEGSDVWREGVGPRPPRALNPKVCVELDERIMRLLSVRPGKRFNSSPREAAASFEQAARSASPQADEPLFIWDTQPAADGPSEKGALGQKPGHRLRHRAPEIVRRSTERDAVAQVELKKQEASEQQRAQAPEEKEEGRLPARRILLIAAVLALIFAIRPQRRFVPPQEEMPEVAQVLPNKEQEGIDGGSTGLGDAVSSKSTAEAAGKVPSSEAAGFAREVPKKPWDWQRRPPCRAGLLEVEIRGGCWSEANSARVKPPCVDGYYEWQGICYMPVATTPRIPTSDEP